MTDARRAGRLSIVGTPIGNMDDASARMARTLAADDAILCEDTRVTGKLCARLGISTPLERADENVLAARIPGFVERIAAGEHLAFVSDAGMPCVSDPGQRLVDAVLDAGLAVEVIPGPSAVTSALALSGLSSARFLFAGFLPRKRGEQRAELEALSRVPATLVAFESPKRVAATLENIADVMPRRRVALVREITKIHEEVLRGTAAELARELAARDALKGECVLVIEEGEAAPAAPELSLADAIADGLAAGEPKSALAKRLAKAYGKPRSEIYDLLV